jgi:ABC-type multidrug transport system ATPase subunit
VILGRSGSGKSITIKCIVGLVLADEGEIKVFGQNIELGVITMKFELELVLISKFSTMIQ